MVNSVASHGMLALFDSHRFRQIARTIDIASIQLGHVVAEQLQWNDGENVLHTVDAARHTQHARTLRHVVGGHALVADDNWTATTRQHLL